MLFVGHMEKRIPICVFVRHRMKIYKKPFTDPKKIIILMPWIFYCEYQNPGGTSEQLVSFVKLDHHHRADAVS